MNKKPHYQLVLFDMDGTLLAGKTIHIFAEKLGFTKELNQILASNQESYTKIIEIAQFFIGQSKQDLLNICQEIPLHNNVVELAELLKQKNIITAIATASYQFIADDLKNRLQFTYAFGNNLLFNKQDIATGELHIHNKKLRTYENKIYSMSKLHVLEELCLKHDIAYKNTIAVGDGANDIPMLQKAGLGIAFHAPEDVQKHADLIINDFQELIDILQGLPAVNPG